MGHNTTQNERNMPELRLRNKKFAYKYQPTIRRNLKDRLPQQNQEQKGKTATQPRPEAEPKKSPQGSKPTEEEKMQPIMPPPEQSMGKRWKAARTRSNMETTHARNGRENETPTGAKTNRQKKENADTEEKTTKNKPQGKKQQPQGRTRQNLQDSKENIDREKDTSQRQPQHEEETLPNDEGTTPTQPKIKIIITPPIEQKKNTGIKNIKDLLKQGQKTRKRNTESSTM